MSSKAPGRPRTFDGATEYQIALKFLRLTRTDGQTEARACKRLATAYGVRESLIRAVVARRRDQAAENIAKVRAGATKFWNEVRAARQAPRWKRWLRGLVR